ncbi:MAG: Xaa-Pro peptidase family protein [Pseudomonadota bacterium]
MQIDWHAARGDLAELALIDAPVAAVDEAALALGRQARLRAQMAASGLAAVLLNDPVNIRYACGARNMQVFAARNGAARYLLMTADRAILFEMFGGEHLAKGLPTLDEVRTASNVNFTARAGDVDAAETRWAAEMAAVLRGLTGSRARIGTERLAPRITLGLSEAGFHLTDAAGAVERARAIKTAEELICIRAALRSTEAGVAALERALRPGLTENALWAVLHQQVIARGGEYFETRLMNSGPRSNPWFQETSAKRIAPNELVALDTDVVGCYGYYADFSRTFHAGPQAPTGAQKALYRAAHDQISHNLSILRPGMSFRDYADAAWPIPERYFEQRYYVSAHGCGMTGEYPYLYHAADFDDAGYDGEITAGMTLCVESFIGRVGGQEGVKLEQQVLITDSGTELLSRYPFDEALLG